MDTKEKLSVVTRCLHWVIAITFIGLMAVGIYMSKTETWALYSLHKSVGILIFAVIIIRVIWRIKNGWPTPVRTYEKAEQLIAKTTHWVLLLGTLVMPISGMLYSGSSGHGFGIFEWTIVNKNYDPLSADQVIPYSEWLTAVSFQVHQIIGYSLIVAIVLHITGALKHHLFDRDKTLLRMLGK